MNGVWLAFIGWFLQNAAASSYAQTNMQLALSDVKVSQVMNRDCLMIPGLLTVNQLVQERILEGGQRCFFVADEGKLRGMITLRDITRVPKQKWRFTTAEQAMVPIRKLVSVDPDTQLLTALQKMDSANVAQVPVLDGEELVGVLSREQIVHFMRTRAALGV